jgi:hypothetical protein
MTRRRTIISIGGSLVVLACASPVAARASTLLSGYGGPGQGNQSMLGSALLNGPGGGATGGGSAGASGSTSSSSGEATPASSRVAKSPATGSSNGERGVSANAKRRARGATPGDAKAGAATSVAEEYAAAERGARAPSTATFGLSGAELTLIALVLGTLAIVSVITRRLARVSAASRQR